MIKSDASGELGCGYHVLSASSDDALWDQWRWEDADALTPEERTAWQHDMCAKELFPLARAVIDNAVEWSGRRVHVGTDNTGAVFSINAGRAKTRNARDLMRRLADVLHDHEIELMACWVPRELNIVADLL